MVCTFFGHKNTPKEIEPTLWSTLTDLIENKQIDVFYVGNQGDFDNIVRVNLKKLQQIYPHIKYSVVLAYFPDNKSLNNKGFDYTDTIFPQGFENVYPKFAIDKRNRWMIEKADVVVTYVNSTIGGAAKYKSIAEKKGKTVINLAK